MQNVIKMKISLSVFLSFCSFFLIAQNYNLELKASVKYPGQVLANIWTYHAKGREYALVGASKGMSIVDVTDPSKPKEIKQLSSLSDIALYRVPHK